MKNIKLNKIKKERAEKNNEKFWHKRIGKCNPQKCSGACCRYNARINPKKREYHDYIQEINKESLFETRGLGKNEITIRNVICPFMTMDCKCKLHNKKKQPYTCDVFPMHKKDAVYVTVKKYCGYKFIKIKNNKYKRKKKIVDKIENDK